MSDGAGMRGDPHISPWTGFRTLLYKEVLRFWKVAFQTIAAPVLNALLFLLIFSHVLDRHVTVYGDIAYTSFLVPGLVMMSLLQNAFANSSSSLIQSKITGNIIFVLLPPISYVEFYAAYVLASVLRGLFVGVGVWLVALPFVDLPMAHPLWVLAFAVFGGGILWLDGGAWWHLGREVRPVVGFPEFSDHAAHDAVRRVLLDSFAAAVVAGCVACEPFLLHDRWLPLRLFRSVRCIALAEPGRGGVLFCIPRSTDPGRAGAGLQAAGLKDWMNDV